MAASPAVADVADSLSAPDRAADAPALGAEQLASPALRQGAPPAEKPGNPWPKGGSPEGAVSANDGAADLAIVTARIVARDPAAEPGEAAFLVEVERQVHGAATASVLAVRLRGDDGRGRRLAEEALAAGGFVELTLEPRTGGSADGWQALAVRAVRPDDVRGEAPDPLPPPLAADPVEPPAATAPGDGPESLRAQQATPGAPFEHQVLELVNHERLENGNLPPLKGQVDLFESAEAHSLAMAERNFFAHCDLDTGTQAWDRMLLAGYAWNAAAENIAAGQSTPQSVMTGWMNSPGHRSNILSTTYRELGVGFVQQANDQATVRLDANGDCTADRFGNGPYFHYWTQNFGRRNDVYPVVIEREAWSTACATVDLYLYGAGFAQEMRFSNNGVTWSAWMPFSPMATWSLDPAASGSATVYVQLRSGGTVRSASDVIELEPGFPATSSRNLSSQTVTGTATWTACDTIRAGNDFRVASTGDVTLRAPTVILQDGFSVASGGELTVAND